MKKGYKVGLFFVLIAVAFVAGALFVRLWVCTEHDRNPETGDFDEAPQDVMEANTGALNEYPLSGYYIIAVDDDIYVYMGDKQTVYFHTGLELTDLPTNIWSEVIDGKYLESEMAVYHFIESYSS